MAAPILQPRVKDGLPRKSYRGVKLGQKLQSRIAILSLPPGTIWEVTDTTSTGMRLEASDGRGKLSLRWTTPDWEKSFVKVKATRKKKTNVGKKED